MSTPPARPKIYHIAHVDRLSSIVADGALFCDATMSGRTDKGTVIGMSSIKQDRLRLSIACRPGLHVGDCVPFNFCPRSVMLYVIYKANHPALAYRGGQAPIVHFEADLRRVIEWAGAEKREWAFSLSNAAASYAEFRADVKQLVELNWDAIRARDWVKVRDEKQAEFLMHGSFPWELVERVGVQSSAIKARAEEAVGDHAHRPA